MGYITRQQRIALTLAFLEMLTDKPQSLGSMALRLNSTRNGLWTLFKKLKKARLIIVAMGVNGGIFRREGATYDETTVRNALGYGLEDKPSEVRCSSCDEVHTRIFVSRDSGRVNYVDRDNRKWLGKKCPDCVLDMNSKPPLPAMSHRKCQDCRAPLAVTRYFECHSCQPSLESIDEDYMYHGASVESRMLDDCDFYSSDHALNKGEANEIN